MHEKINIIIKFSEILLRGVGELYKPVQKGIMAKTAAFEMDQIAPLIKKYQEEGISIQYDNGNVRIEVNEEDASFLGDMMYREIKYQNNVERIVDNAYKMINDKEMVSNEPVDDDWINFFFDWSRKISNEKMQQLWGQILSRKVASPATYSIRTLDVLRKIEEYEADIFVKNTAFVIEDFIPIRIKVGKHIQPQDEYWFSVCHFHKEREEKDYKRLQECGLLQPSYSKKQVVLYKLDKGSVILKSKSYGLIIRESLDWDIFSAFH